MGWCFRYQSTPYLGLVMGYLRQKGGDFLRFKTERDEDISRKEISIVMSFLWLDDSRTVWFLGGGCHG